MKKMLFCLFFSFIIFVSFNLNVSASTVYNFTTAYEYKADLAYVWLENGEVKSEIIDKSLIDRIKNYMDSRGKYYIISFYNPSYNAEPYPYNDQYYTEILIYEFDNIPTLSFNSTGILRTSINGYEYHIYSDKDSYIETVNSIDSYISSLESISLSDNISTSTNRNILYTSYIDSNIPPDRNNSRIIYYSNFDIIYNSQDDIIIGNYTISDGDEFITLSDYKQLTEEENEGDEVVYDFPNIEPLEGFERYAVISTNYNYNSGGTSTTGEPNYYLLYFNQNFTYDGNSSRELLWPDNTNLSSVNLLLYNISNNSWQPLITNLVYFSFPESYTTASYNTKVVYSNFDIYYKDSDEIYFKSSIDSPSEPIHYQYKASATTNEESPYYVEYKMLSGVVEKNKKFDYKISSIQERDGYYDVPSTPRLELYKIVSDEYVLVDDDTISYTYREEFTDNTYYLIGDIKFSDDIVYSDDYVLRFVFDEIDNAKLDFYDSASLTFWGCYSSFLDGYTLYTFKGGSSGYAISYNNDFKGKIYVETKYINEPYNFGAGYYHYSIKTRGEELLFNEFSNGEYSYIDFTIEYFNNSQDENHILTVFKNIENNDDVVFYVPKELTVSEITVSNVNEDGTVDFEFIMNTPNGEGTFNEEFNYNFGDEEFINTFTGAINFFITPIKEIFKLTATFYNNLTLPLKMFFVSLFGLGISVFIVRFLL